MPPTPTNSTSFSRPAALAASIGGLRGRVVIGENRVDLLDAAERLGHQLAAVDLRADRRGRRKRSGSRDRGMRPEMPYARSSAGSESTGPLISTIFPCLAAARPATCRPPRRSASGSAAMKQEYLSPITARSNTIDGDPRVEQLGHRLGDGLGVLGADDHQADAACQKLLQLGLLLGGVVLCVQDGTSCRSGCLAAAASMSAFICARQAPSVLHRLTADDELAWRAAAADRLRLGPTGRNRPAAAAR